MKSLYDNIPGKERTACQEDPDKRAFSALVHLHYEELYKYAVKFTRNADSAKDEVNEFFVLVWEKRSLFFAAEHPKNYLLSSFKNFLSWRLASLQRDKNQQFMYVSGLCQSLLSCNKYEYYQTNPNNPSQATSALLLTDICVKVFLHPGLDQAFASRQLAYYERPSVYTNYGWGRKPLITIPSCRRLPR